MLAITHWICLKRGHHQEFVVPRWFVLPLLARVQAEIVQPVFSVVAVSVSSPALLFDWFLRLTTMGDFLPEMCLGPR